MSGEVRDTKMDIQKKTNNDDGDDEELQMQSRPKGPQLSTSSGQTERCNTEKADKLSAMLSRLSKELLAFAPDTNDQNETSQPQPSIKEDNAQEGSKTLGSSEIEQNCGLENVHAEIEHLEEENKKLEVKIESLDETSQPKPSIKEDNAQEGSKTLGSSEIEQNCGLENVHAEIERLEEENKKLEVKIECLDLEQSKLELSLQNDKFLEEESLQMIQTFCLDKEKLNKCSAVASKLLKWAIEHKQKKVEDFLMKQIPSLKEIIRNEKKDESSSVEKTKSELTVASPTKKKSPTSEELKSHSSKPVNMKKKGKQQTASTATDKSIKNTKSDNQRPLGNKDGKITQTATGHKSKAQCDLNDDSDEEPSGLEDVAKDEFIDIRLSQFVDSVSREEELKNFRESAWGVGHKAKQYCLAGLMALAVKRQADEHELELMKKNMPKKDYKELMHTKDDVARFVREKCVNMLHAMSLETLPRNNANTIASRLILWATMEGYTEMVCALLEQVPACKTAVDECGYTPLHIAATLNYAEIVQVLIDAEADKEAVDTAKQTPLIQATCLGHLKVVKILLKNGANKKIRWMNNMTLLHMPIEQFQFDDARTELAKAKKINYFIPVSHHHEVLRELIKAGLDIEAKTDKGLTPLHLAACYDSVRSLDVLVELGANVNSLDNKGETPLHCAAIYNNASALECLLKTKCNIEASDKKGCTALHLAACFGHREAVTILLKAEANPQAKNLKGKIPYDLCSNYYVKTMLKVNTP